MEELSELTVRRAASGDEDAFSQIVRAYQKPVYNLSLSILHDPEDAFDASQETFLKLFRSLPSFRFDCSVSSFLYRIARNTALDAVRARKRRPHESLEEKNEAGFEPADSGEAGDPFFGTVRSERRRMLYEAIEELSEQHREVIRLSAFCGLSYEKVAETLEIEIGTVKSRLNRAKKELKKILLKRNFF